MAALRLRKLLIPTKEDVIKHMRREARKKSHLKKLSDGAGRPKKPGSYVRMYEVVATTPQEAQSPLFKQVGELFVFIPEQAEHILWQRLRTMDHPEHRDLWYHPYWGIKAALKKFKVAVPTPRWRTPAGASPFPSSILDLEYHDIIPERIDPVTGEVRHGGGMQTRRTYETFVRDYWLPAFLYRSKSARTGLFPDTKNAQAVASAFGITVDRYAKSSDWFRTQTPDIVTEAERSVEVSEEAYQQVRDSIMEGIKANASQGMSYHPDWNIVMQLLASLFKGRARDVYVRLKAEIDPYIDSIDSGKLRFDENRPRAYRR